MTRSTEWLSKWIYILASSLYFVAVTLRVWLYYRDGPYLGRAMGFLMLWLLLISSEPVISRRWPGYFPVYVVLQTTLVFLLMATPGTPDFVGALLGVLSMQVMLRLPTRVGLAWIGLCGVILMLVLGRAYQSQAIALSLIMIAGIIFLGSYARTIRKAQAARLENQNLADELVTANHLLQDYSTQIKQLAVARERNRLARELHDSVTQTVFSMTLTTQSAALLFERDRTQVAAQLERLCELAQSALAEMQLLINKLKPGQAQLVGLPVALRELLADSRFCDSLSVSFDVVGDKLLDPAEQQGLFHIAQEALNNVLKHARTSQVQVRLHLQEPYWMEIEDHGQGFDMQYPQPSGHVGLASMREWAAEIGWALEIETSPGEGTHLRVQKTGLEKCRDDTS